jgi:hypothetical protein
MARKHNMSDEGRRRCAESGLRNLERAKATRGEQRAEIEAAVDAFRIELAAELGPEMSAAQAAGVVSACALYTSILQTQRSLLIDQSRRARIAALQANLPVLTGSLLRVLRSLGIDLRGAGGESSDSPPANASPEDRRAWAKDYVERVVEGSAR